MPNFVGTAAKPALSAVEGAVRPGKARQSWDVEVHLCSTSQTKQGFAWRRDQPECACPEGKSLPL